jgi:acyl dehydratase
MTGKTIAELSEGDHAELTRVVEHADVEAFVDAVGDYNPLHSDPEYAATTMFRAPIAPGIFTAGMISAVIGTQLPGPGAVYLSQDLKFLKPVKPGDTITARVEVVELIRDRNRIRLKTVCANQRAEEVLTGEAWVLPSRRPIVFEPKPEAAAALRAWSLQPWTWAARAVTLWGLVSLSALAALTPRQRRRPD